MEFEKPKKIFIVDDNVMYTKALKNHLVRHAAHQVSLFSTGEECLEHISEKPDIVILDFYLNSVKKDAVNGLEILETIRKNYADTFVVMLSSQESYATALKSIQKGAEQYVIKDESSFEKISKIIQEQ